MDQNADVRFTPLRLIASTDTKMIRILLVVAGFALALGGQAVLPSNAPAQIEGLMQGIAGSMLFVGALLFGALMPSSPGLKLIPRLEFTRGRVSKPVSKWRKPWTLCWLGASVVLAAAALGMFATTGETPTVIIIWLLSILALYVSQVTSVQISLPRVPPNERIYLVGLIVLLIVALITRAYQLTTLPYNLDGDFADVGLQARALATGEQQQIFTYGWASIPILGYLPSWLTMTIFGTGLTGLNASGVIEGLLIIIGVYLLGRDLFHARIGLFAAALLTISYTHLAASRQPCIIDPVFFILFTIYFLLVGLREGRGWALVTSGVLTALCLQMYYSGRLVVFIVAFILLYLFLFRRAWLWARLWCVFIWALAAIVALGPMLLVFIQGSDGFISRTREVFILNPDVVRHMQSVYLVDTVPDLLIQQARRTALLFNYYPDTSTHFALRRPFLDPFTGALFFLGVGCALFRYRRLGYAAVLGWGLLGIVVGCFLTVNPPFWPRLMILLPPTAFLAALALNQLYELTCRGLARVEERAVIIASTMVVLLIAGVGILNWSTYVEAKGAYANRASRIGRYLADQPSSTQAYLVSADLNYQEREFDFLARGRLITNLIPEQAEQEIATLDGTTLVIVTPEQNELLAHLEQQYQGETVKAIMGNSPDEVAFYVFQLP
jgi:4-amino-4-deoxy-L-arabinose transferase-like glycosyltransferase